MENPLPEETMASRHTAEHFDLVSNWYENLKDFTWETKFIPISVLQADSICSYRSRCRGIFLSRFHIADTIEIGGLSNMIDKNDEVAMSQLKAMDPRKMIKEEEREALKDLSKLLDDVIGSFLNEEGNRSGAFVRMDTRSPKDAALNSKKVYEELEKEIHNRKHDDVYSQDCVNDDVISYWRAISRCQRVETGEEALELLIKSNRVQEDIMRGKLKQGSEKYAPTIVIRKWMNIDPDLEFRTFVVQGKVTGITQYHMKLYNPLFTDNKEKIQSLILEKVNEVHHLIHAPNETYTIDFVFSPDFSRCSLIEINDPPPTAGTSLFIWENEEDRKLLSHGPLTVRVLSCGSAWENHTDMHTPLKEYIDILRKRKVEVKEDKVDNINHNKIDNTNHESHSSKEGCFIQ